MLGHGALGQFALGQGTAVAASPVMLADAGTFTHTYNAASFVRARTLAAAAGVFTHTYDAATIAAKRKLVTSAGSFTHTYNAATLARAGKIIAAAGSFIHTYNSASFLPNYNLAAQAGSFTHTYNAAVLARFAEIIAASGSFTHTYIDATLSQQNRAVNAEVAAFIHVYMAAQLAFSSTRTFKRLTKPVNRQIIDPKTGILRQEWEVHLRSLADAINTINQNITQG